jgi:plasmid stabilization system protein ParE
MADYQLTPKADDDLSGIAGYTIVTRGEEQAEYYAGKLRSCFEAIGRGKARSRKLLKTRPDLLVIRCEHHYVFYRLRKGQSPLIIAVFHENMDLMIRLRNRLDA